jgi:hypothetical protein
VAGGDQVVELLAITLAPPRFHVSAPSVWISVQERLGSSSIIRYRLSRALQHLAAAGPPELQAKSRHQHLASLGTYVRLGEQTSARVTADTDPAARRRG